MKLDDSLRNSMVGEKQAKCDPLGMFQYKVVVTNEEFCTKGHAALYVEQAKKVPAPIIGNSSFKKQYP